MAVNLSPVGGVAAQFFDNNGVILTGGKIYTYAAGTSTPQVTYTSSSGATAHSNPIILDASGRVPGGEIWLTDGLSYKFLLKDANDVLIGTYDNITGINSNFINYTGEQEIQTATAGQTVFTLTTMQYQPGTNSLSVFVDGVNQYGPGAQYAYVETSSTVITFVTGLHVGASVKFTSTQINAASYGDAFQISYTPPFTASVATNVGDKLAQYVNVKDFGAVGDGTTNDTTAVQNAISYAATVNAPLYIPEGTYLLTSAITVSSANRVNILGAGRRNAILFWSNAAATRGLSITYTDVITPPKITGLSLLTGATTGGTALLITGPEAASVTYLGPYVDDLEITAADANTSTWDIGLHFYTCWYICLSNVTIKGTTSDNVTYPMVAGIKLTSCQVTFMTNFTIIHSETGILEAASGVATHGEGFCFENFEIIGGLDAINLTADNVAPGTNIGPGHTNTNRYGIKLRNQYQTSIHDMLMYKTQLSTDNYICIELYDCNSCHIHDNEIKSSAGPTTDTTGIVLTGTTASDYNNIHDNSFGNFNGTTKTGIIIGTGSGNNIIHHNLGDSSLTNLIVANVDAEPVNFLFANVPSVWTTLTVNSQTPSVGNTSINLFYITNTLATVITDFSNGFVGQQITVVSNNSNTTIQHNANMILLSGVPYGMVAGNTLTLARDTNLWREISRTG